MTTALVYCTANVSVECINDFLTASSEHPDADGTSWSLEREPDQTIEDKTTPPIPSFTTGFQSWSSAQLEQHHKSRLPKSTGFWTHRTFASLDERSAGDRTVVMTTLIETWPQEYLDTSTVDPNAKIVYWKSWRVRFEDAGRALAAIDVTQPAWLELTEDEGNLDERDIFRFPE